jgi:trans-feruloyl-CoA hydratase/vanillin synthase
MTSFPHVELTIDGAVATVRLARPEKKNSMSPALHQSMNDALSEVESTEEVKVCVVTGTDDSFCGGMDLEQCFLEPFDDPQRFRAVNAVALQWFRRLKDLSAVTVAKVNGWCFGGGFELAGICDIVIARDDAVFGLSEINFGIFPGGGTMWATAHNLPRKQALYYALTAETFTGAQAVQLGLATRAVPADQLDEEVARVVAQLVDKNRETLRATKSVYEWSVDLDFAKSIDLEMAKLQELSYLSRNDWIRTALTQFNRRQFRPGLQSYSLSATD